MELIYKLLDELNMEYSPQKSGNIIYDENDILKQVKIISEFHKAAQNVNGEYLLILESNLGKRFQRLKVQLKRNERYFNEIRERGAADKFENALIENCSSIFQQAKYSLQQAENDCGYLELILRSMNRNELSIGDGSSENLFFNKKINIKNLKKITLDMVEWDMINFLFRMKRRNIKFDCNKVIKEFIRQEDLEQNSEDFIKAILEYPLEFMKLCDKKRQDKKPWTVQQYENKLYLYINKASGNK